MSGNEAVARAVKLAKVGVVSIYPITPQTTIIEKLSEMRAEGELSADIIRVESEHSAMAGAFGAASAGVRSFTATASQGLLYMHEMVWWVSGARIPLVMVVATRAVGAPWNIWNENTDFTQLRDAGWVMGFAMNPQEAMDMTIQAFRVSEDSRVFLPAMVGMDGFILSHTKVPVNVPTEESVDSFLPLRNQPYVLDPEDPVGMGNMFQPQDYMKLRHSMEQALQSAEEVIREVGRDYNSKVNSEVNYSTLNVTYRVEDADYVVVAMGAWSGDVMEAVDSLREKGISVGLLRLRYLRPWSSREVREALKGRKVLVLDRSTSLGRGGPLFMEVASTVRGEVEALWGAVSGLGGVSVGKGEIEELVTEFVEGTKSETEKQLWFYPGKVRKVELRTPRDVE
ncbi:transketolase C-terminal domain-containing protein [Sulfodiicoccus acidiphilus]|nr:transketolase C-terminal domain-containing protein [Sulfodiicoccus acidiphilus]